MIIKCVRCGCEFESKFCPDCGLAREESSKTEESVETSEEPSSEESVEITAEPSSEESIEESEEPSAEVPKKPKITLPILIGGIAFVILFVLAMIIYSAFGTSSTTTEASKKEESVAADNQLDKKTQKKLNKAYKYIENNKFDKAKKIIDENDFGKSENAHVREEYYLAQNDYLNAVTVLIDYCNDLPDPADAVGDERYSELLELRDKVPEKTEEINSLEHSVDVAYLGFENGHDWIDATCTESRYCAVCDEIDGDPLGHDWAEATCTEAKICNRCQLTEGDPLGHNVEEWTVVRESTCTEKGIENGICSLCGTELEQEIDCIEHTPGEWVIVSEATDTASGKKAIRCTVCDNEIKTETYSLSEDEKKEYYKKRCVSVSYDDLIRYPDKYENTPIKCTVYISEVETVDSFLFNDQYEGKMGGKYVSVFDDRTTKEPKFRAGDTVTIYGVGKGYNTMYTYEKGGLLGLPKNIESQKIPAISVKYAVIN